MEVAAGDLLFQSHQPPACAVVDVTDSGGDDVCADPTVPVFSMCDEPLGADLAGGGDPFNIGVGSLIFGADQPQMFHSTTTRMDDPAVRFVPSSGKISTVSTAAVFFHTAELIAVRYTSLDTESSTWPAATWKSLKNVVLA